MIINVEKDLKLETTSEEFASELFAVLNKSREYLSKFLPWVEDIRTSENMRAYLQDSVRLCKNNQELSFVLIYKGNPVGRIGLHHINLPNRTGSIGYWIDKEAQGNGIVIKSCIALIDYGFKTLNLNRVEIKASVDNFKSQAIPKKLKFVKEGVLRQAEFVDNHYTDLYCYSLLKEEWQKQKEILF